MGDDLAAVIGANVRAARLAARLTTQQVASRLGNSWTAGTVEATERGERHSLQLQSVSRLAAVLDVDVFDLVRRPGS